jgi:hypothetical protein
MNLELMKILGQSAAEVNGDKSASEQLMVLLTVVSVTVPPTTRGSGEMMLAAIQAFLDTHDAQVREQVLQDQKATNDALAAALGMRGQK